MSDVSLWLAVATLVAAGSCAAYGAVTPPDEPGMAVKVEAGDYVVRGHSVTVPATVELSIDPPERISVVGERQVLTDEKPSGWCRGTVLTKTLGPVDTGTRYPKAIDPMSVRVYSCDDPKAVYLDGKDYTLDSTWGGLSRIGTGALASDTEVCVDYAVFLQRIDLVQVTKGGKASVKRGRSAMANPAVPEPDEGCAALANIWVAFRTTAITSDLIFPMPAEDITWRSFIKSSGRKNLSNTLGLLRKKKPVTVVCWGDSVTAGGSPSSHDKCYVERFRSMLKASYPDTPITLINAGIGGSSTDSRRDGFEKEVLDHNPDLITVEYVNDAGMPAEKIKTNYAEFIARARAKNPAVEFIIITPHYVMADWMGNFEVSVPAMRQAARDNKAALADAANIWANLGRVGIPYETLEANGINHPNDLGHEFFAECLMELLRP